VCSKLRSLRLTLIFMNTIASLLENASNRTIGTNIFLIRIMFHLVFVNFGQNNHKVFHKY